MQVAKYWRTKKLRYRLVRDLNNRDNEAYLKNHALAAQCLDQQPVKRKLVEIAS